jgi:Tfp pilus assembly protein PilO
MQRLLKKRERIIFYLVVGLIIASVGFNLVMEPLLAKNKNLGNEINTGRAKLKKYAQLLAQKDAIESEFNKFSVSLNNPGLQAASVSALSELENLASAAKIRIVDIRPQSTKTVQLYKETIIELKTEGSMEDFLKFIYSIENSLFLLKIKRLVLTARSESGLLEANISISQISLE